VNEAAPGAGLAGVFDEGGDVVVDGVAEARGQGGEALAGEALQLRPFGGAAAGDTRIVSLHCTSAERHRIPMHRLAILCASIAGAVVTAFAAEPPYVTIGKTYSPDDRFGFAWSLPAKFKVNWEAVVQGDVKAVPKGFEDHVINYLVGLDPQKILATVPKAQAFELDGEGGNHRDLAIAWAPKSDFAVAIYSQKWGYTSFTGFHVTRARASSLDLGKPLEAAYRQELSAAAGARYAKKRDSLSVSFSNPKGGPDGTFTVQANAEVPKSVEDDDVFDSKLVRFELQADPAGKLSLKSVKVEKAAD
jgi:hypothetical protein